MSMNTDTNVIKDVTNSIHSFAPNVVVTHYTPPEQYNDKKLLSADLVIISVEKNKTEQGASYLSKGQYSELENCICHSVPFVIYTWDTWYKFDHHVPNDYNDWKGKYGKVFLDGTADLVELFAKALVSPEEMLLL